VGITGLLGAAAFWRRRRRKRGAEIPEHEDLGPDPAEELRTKLAASRATETETDTEPIATEDALGSPLDPEVRRKSVHDRARASIDELK
jgi:hypothetical protein